MLGAQARRQAVLGQLLCRDPRQGRTHRLQHGQREGRAAGLGEGTCRSNTAGSDWELLDHQIPLEGAWEAHLRLHLLVGSVGLSTHVSLLQILILLEAFFHAAVSFLKENNDCR